MAGLLDEEREYLSRSDVADIFGVAPNTVTRWAEAGKLPYIRTLGGHRRYDKEAIERLAREFLQLSQEEEGVKNITLYIPRMYGDHHVTTVRELLMGLNGIEEVWTSAAFQQATVTYDSEIVSTEDITAKLESEGYPIGDEQQPEAPPRRKRDPAWDEIGIRMTSTNRADIEMSGEFRRY